MTMYVRTTAPLTLTISSQTDDDDVLLDGNHPYAVLPLWAAQRAEFQSLWDEEKVEVATDPEFNDIVTEIPVNELLGGGEYAALDGNGRVPDSLIPNSLHLEEIVDVEGHTLLRLADGTANPSTPSNYLVVTNASVGNAPSIAVEATVDTNVDLELSSLGDGSVFVKNSGGTMLETWGTNNAVHHMAFANAAANQPVEFGVVGGQTGDDVDINAYPMGSGRFYVNYAPVITGVQLLNNQEGDYTLTVADVGKLVAFGNTVPMTATVPLAATSGLTLGSRIELAQTGPGAVSVAIGDPAVSLIVAPGTTVQTDGDDKVLAALLSGLGATATLTMITNNTWLLAGSLAGA